MPWILPALGTAAISTGFNLLSQASSNKAAAESTAAQIAASEALLAESIASQEAMMEASIGAQYDIFHQQKAAQYDIFNKSMEAQYEIYNATQQAKYKTLLEQFEFQKTSELTTAKAGVRIAGVEANAIKEAARVQMAKNVKAAQIQTAFNLEAAQLEAAGMREAADILYGQEQRNIENMWMEATEQLRRTAMQQDATRATARAIVGASGGTFAEGTSQSTYYGALSDEMFKQYNWMEAAYISQKDAAVMAAEENKLYAYKQAGTLVQITESENKAIMDSIKIANDALWETANIQGGALIEKAEITLEAVEEIYSRDYFTPPDVLTYEPTSPPGGGGGGHGGGGHGGGGGGGGGGGSAYSDQYYEVYSTGGGKKFQVGADFIDYYTENRNYVVSGYYGTDKSGKVTRLAMPDYLKNRKTSSGTKQGYTGYTGGMAGGGAGGYESNNWSN